MEKIVSFSSIIFLGIFLKKMKNELNDMALFVEIARLGSFKLASERLKMPLATLSRRFALFEKQLNLKLINRSTRTMHLTEMGLFYFEKAKNIIDEAHFLNESLKTNLKNPSGKIKLSLPIDFTLDYLSPILMEFIKTYPDIQFEFHLTPQVFDLFNTDFDLALRIGNIQDSSLITHCAFQLNPQCFASPLYLKNHPHKIETPEDLTRHQVILFSQQNHWVLFQNKIKKEVILKSRFESNNIAFIKHLALQHFGIILLPSLVVKKEIEEGKLVLVLKDWTGAGKPVTLLGTTRLLPFKTRLLKDFLKSHFEADFPRSSCYFFEK